MSSPIVSAGAGAAAALTAVLREAGPRAMVFAELLCGDARQADAAMAFAVRALGNELVRAPVVDWTQRFWTLLLAAPPLRQPARGGRWPASLHVLAQLAPGLRAVVLLRILGRLDETAAARVLGIPTARYRRALQRALPRDPQGRVDVAAWQRLVAECRRGLWEGPDPRSGRLDRLFAEAARPGVATAPSAHPSWIPVALWIALLACALAFGATFLWGPARVEADPQIQATALPAPSDPASTFDADTAVLTHPDFDALVDPGEQALGEHLGFYAWYAAQLAAAPGADGPPLVFPDAAGPAPMSPDPATRSVEVPGAPR